MKSFKFPPTLRSYPTFISYFLLFMLHLFVPSSTHSRRIIHKPPKKHIIFNTVFVCRRCRIIVWDAYFFAVRMLTIMCWGETRGELLFFSGVDDLTWYTIFFSYYIFFIHFFPLLWTIYWEQATGVNKKRIFVIVCARILFSL